MSQQSHLNTPTAPEEQERRLAQWTSGSGLSISRLHHRCPASIRMGYCRRGIFGSAKFGAALARSYWARLHCVPCGWIETSHGAEPGVHGTLRMQDTTHKQRLDIRVGRCDRCQTLSFWSRRVAASTTPWKRWAFQRLLRGWRRAFSRHHQPWNDRPRCWLAADTGGTALGVLLAHLRRHFEERLGIPLALLPPASSVFCCV